MKTLALTAAITIGSMFNPHDHPAHKQVVQQPEAISIVTHHKVRNLAGTSAAETERLTSINQYVREHRSELENR